MIIIICIVVLYPFTTYREKSVIFNDRLFTVLDNQLVEDEILPYFYDEMIAEQEVLYYYSHQNLSFFMEIDHFDPCFHRPLKDLRDSDIPDGSVIIWDNWFSVVEEGIRLEDLKNDPRFELVRIFTSKDKFRIVEYVVFRAIA
nr:hypothetical protein [Bacteroidota bacterium]